MADLARVLKQEIRRIARKEVRTEVEATRKASAQYRRDIAALKRQVQALSKKVAYLEAREERSASAKPPAKLAEGARFSPDLLKGQRQRLGLSVVKYAQLAGVHPNTLIKWEQGEYRPRKEKLAVLVSLRGIGKREAMARLEKMER